MGVAPLEGLTRLPQVTTGTGQRTVALTGWRGGAVTAVETMRLALDALRAHKLRSFLTVFGVVHGVSVIMLVAALITGFDQQVQESIK